MNYKIFDNVKIGKNVRIEDNVIIGTPPKGRKEGELETIIGNNSVIRAQTVIYAGNKIGDNFQTGNGVNIREENVIGSNVSIGTRTVIEHHVNIEDNTRIHSLAFIPEFCHLKKNCWVGPSVVLTNAKYPKSKNVKQELKGVVLGENSIIGANSTLLPGIRIGKNAIIGAGSVVVKDVQENNVVVGNPAKVINDKNSLKKY